MQNEPHFEPHSYPGMYLSAKNESVLAIKVGTKLRAAGLKTKILVWDHNWNDPSFSINAMNNSEAYQWIDGSAFHCYEGEVSAQVIHNNLPNFY